MNFYSGKKKINAVLLIINIYLWDKTIRYIIQKILLIQRTDGNCTPGTYLDCPRKKKKKKKTTLKNPIILKGFENSPRTASLDTRKLDCLVCKANDKAFRNVQELFRTAMHKINLKNTLPCNLQWQHHTQQTFFFETKLCQKNF